MVDAEEAVQIELTFEIQLELIDTDPPRGGIHPSVRAPQSALKASTNANR